VASPFTEEEGLLRLSKIQSQIADVGQEGNIDTNITPIEVSREDFKAKWNKYLARKKDKDYVRLEALANWLRVTAIQQAKEQNLEPAACLFELQSRVPPELLAAIQQKLWPGVIPQPQAANAPMGRLMVW
jgi:hypothetical protein